MTALRPARAETMPIAIGFSSPFPHFLCPDLLAAQEADRLRRAIDGSASWMLQAESFYDHWSVELQCSGKPAPDVLADPLIDRAVGWARDAVAGHFGAVLAGATQVMAHRMEPGHRVEVHNDAPVLGFECYRVLLYLDRPPAGEGQLLLYASENGAAVRSIAPEPGLCVGMALGKSSLHSVSPIARGLRTALVINFWHAGNSPATERAILAHVARLRDEAHPIGSWATLMLASCRAAPDAKQVLAANLACRTLASFGAEQAECSALLLAMLPRSCWGSAPVLAGADACMRAEAIACRLESPPAADSPRDRLDRSILLAYWIGRLAHGVFDPAEWTRRRREIDAVRSELTGAPAEWAKRLFPPDRDRAAAPEAEAHVGVGPGSANY